MRRGARTLLWTAVMLLALVTLIQWIGTMTRKEAAADPLRMLYEVSQLQVELLSSFVGEAAQAGSTAELNALKQAAYSADYTHKRLVMAGGKSWPELASISELMDVIVRLQIGGDRRLSEEEKQLFRTIAPHFNELQAAYAALMPHGTVDKASAARVKAADQAVSKAMEASGR